MANLLCPKLWDNAPDSVARARSKSRGSTILIYADSQVVEPEIVGRTDGKIKQRILFFFIFCITMQQWEPREPMSDKGEIYAANIR